jgi:glutathione peroxidase
MSIYNFVVKDFKGNDVDLSVYKGQVLLVINTAIKCGFTPQYSELQSLYTEYKDRGFKILDFPCNQFKEQAPGSGEEINSFCQLNFGIKFDQFAKVEVNGENEAPLYTYLKSVKPKCDVIDDAWREFRGFLDYETSNIHWNFEKFLINREGEVVMRLDPSVKPSELAKYLEELI